MIKQRIRIIDERVCDVFTLKFREDGILHIHISNKHEYSIDSIKELNSLIAKISNNTSLPVLMSADDFVVFPTGARENNAKKSTFPYIKAVAYLTRTLAHKLIISAYIKINKPERPTKMFESEERSIEWLKTFCRPDSGIRVNR